jgi:hypothetical protein
VSRDAYSPLERTGWHARGLRLIAFTVEPLTDLRKDWWKDLTHSEPEESSRRKELVEQAGPWEENRRLTVAVDPFRIQWAYDPSTTAQQIIQEVPTLPDLTEEKEKFLSLMRKWLGQSPPIKRLGFATHLLYGADSHEHAYRLLDRMLPHVEVDPEASDFLYRINRKAKSRADPDGLEINRLATWSAIRLVTRLATIVETVPEQRQVNEEFFLSLELDVNTPPLRTQPFKPELLGDIFAELANCALGVACAGDVKE